MGTKKNKTEVTPGWSPPPNTPDINTLREHANTPYDYATPIRNQYARAEQNYSQSYKNPLGAYTTADVRDKSIREHSDMMNQNLGMDISNAGQRSNQAQFGQLSTVAGLTAPQFYHASTSQPFTGGDAVGFGANIFSSILGKGG